MTATKNIYVLCALCREDIPEELFGETGHVADHHVYKYGELKYIELAHRECAETDNFLRKEQYWAWTQLDCTVCGVEVLDGESAVQDYTVHGDCYLEKLAWDAVSI